MCGYTSAGEWKSLPSKRMRRYGSSLRMKMGWPISGALGLSSIAARAFSSCSGMTRPLGLCGELRIINLVLGVMACFDLGDVQVAGRHVELDSSWGSLRGEDQLLVEEPRRGEEDRLVAGLEQGAQRDGDRGESAVGHVDVVRDPSRGRSALDMWLRPCAAPPARSACTRTSPCSSARGGRAAPGRSWASRHRAGYRRRSSRSRCRPQGRRTGR